MSSSSNVWNGSSTRVTGYFLVGHFGFEHHIDLQPAFVDAVSIAVDSKWSASLWLRCTLLSLSFQLITVAVGELTCFEQY